MPSTINIAALLLCLGALVVSVCESADNAATFEELLSNNCVNLLDGKSFLTGDKRFVLIDQERLRFDYDFGTSETGSLNSETEATGLAKYKDRIRQVRLQQRDIYLRALEDIRRLDGEVTYYNDLAIDDYDHADD